MRFTRSSRYQPASRFWPFQWYETAIYVVVAVGICARSATGGCDVASPDATAFGESYQIARILLLRGSCVTSARPRASRRGGRYYSKSAAVTLSQSVPSTDRDWRSSVPTLRRCPRPRVCSRRSRRAPPSRPGQATTRAGPRRPTFDTSTSWIQRHKPARGDRRPGRGTSCTSTIQVVSSASTDHAGRPWSRNHHARNIVKVARSHVNRPVLRRLTPWRVDPRSAATHSRDH